MTGRDDEPPRIRLRAPSGVVIDHSLPLHEAIEGQWLRGELERVTADGSPWEGDQYDLSGARGEGPAPAAGAARAKAAPAQAAATPARPPENAPKQAWQEYAVTVGAVSEADAAGLTRAELIDRATPPEMRPPDPEG